MKKTLGSLVLTATVLASFGCSNWNRMTPSSMDSTAIEAEIRKNMATDKITGLTVAVNDGVVTLSGHLPTSADRQKAYDDAAKVKGVKRVTNRIDVP